MNFNKAIIAGRITQDLELKTTTGGKNVCSFSVATSKKWKDQSGTEQEKTEFHNVVAWDKQAEAIAKYFVKGQVILVEGRLETRSWEDEASKKKMYRTEIVLEKFEFGEKPRGTEAKPQGTPIDYTTKDEMTDEEVESIPF